MCSNCGYSFLNESRLLTRTFHSCPRCGQKLNPPITVGKPNESEKPRRDYKPILD
jgi:NAD-dependent SIR2 family protein deacetylase